MKENPQKKTCSLFLVPCSLSRFRETGQVAVLILLISVVGLTIGLSIASRSISTLKETATTEESNRAFSAAEAGVEEALQIIKETGSVPPAILTPTPFPEARSEFTYQAAAVGGGTEGYAVEAVEKDDVVEVKLEGSSATSLDIYWTQTGSVTSLLMAFITFDGANYGILRYAVNCGTGAPGNGFDSGSSTTKSGYSCEYSVSVSADAKILRIRPMYSNANILVEPSSPAGATLPAQSYKIVSTGKAGETQRTVEVIQSFPALPAIFDYVLFSGSETQPLSK